jgi:hypothetical protein
MILALVQDAAEHGETYTDLLSSRAHWAFELTLEALTSLVLFPLGVLYQRWHDRKHHAREDIKTPTEKSNMRKTPPAKLSGHPDDWTPEQWASWSKSWSKFREQL